MNLLPPQERKNIALENISRAAFVGGLALFFAALISLATLAPAIFLTSGSDASAAAEVPALLLKQVEEDRKEVKITQAAAKDVSSVVSSSTPVAQIVERVLALRPSGVRITAISFTDGPERSLVLGGESDNRNALGEYRSRIISAGIFKNVSFPVGALAGVANAPFTITSTGF